MQYEGPFFRSHRNYHATASGTIIFSGGEVMTLSDWSGDLMGEVGGRKYRLQTTVLHNLLGFRKSGKLEIYLKGPRTVQGHVEEGCLLLYGK
jgi:hypothetical protein